ncbi:MAG: hypothetical protein AB7F31_01885 [Parachlamydiales bacterium]
MDKNSPLPSDLSPANKTTPWYVSGPVFVRSSEGPSDLGYRKVAIQQGDPELDFIVRYFQHSAPPEKGIVKVYAILNWNATRSFESTLYNQYVTSQQLAFQPKWPSKQNDPQLQLRHQAIQRWDSARSLFKPFKIPSQGERLPLIDSVGILPLWHATSGNNCHSICKTGFQSFGNHQGSATHSHNTDEGYFGKGFYFTDSAKYAAQYYSSDGHLLLAWVSMRSPYPVVSDGKQIAKCPCSDMHQLMGKSNYENHDAHFIPINSNCHPCMKGQTPECDEVVVFSQPQALVSFWVEFGSISLSSLKGPSNLLQPKPVKPSSEKPVPHLVEFKPAKPSSVKQVPQLKGPSKPAQSTGSSSMKEAPQLKVPQNSTLLKGPSEKQPFKLTGPSKPAQSTGSSSMKQVPSFKATLKPVEPVDPSFPKHFVILDPQTEPAPTSGLNSIFFEAQGKIMEKCFEDLMAILGQIVPSKGELSGEQLARLKMEAQQGDPRAQVGVGLTLLTSQEAEALVWFFQAAENGNVEARILIALHYVNKNSYQDACKVLSPLTKTNNVFVRILLAKSHCKLGNSEEYLRIMTEWANGGCKELQCWLGLSYCLGEGVPKQLLLAEKWLALAYGQGLAEARGPLNACRGLLSCGEPNSKGPTSGLSHPKPAKPSSSMKQSHSLSSQKEEVTSSDEEGADSGDEDVGKNVFIGMLRQMNEDLIDGLREEFQIGPKEFTPDELSNLKHLGAQGDLRSQIWLGLHLGPKGEDAEGVVWLLQAAEQGHGAARCLLACYYFDKGDLKAGQNILEPAAKQGHYMAKMLLLLLGLLTDAKASKEGLTKLAEEGRKEAQFMLGMLYRKGKDFHSAAEWLFKASVQGVRGADTLYAECCAELSEMYERGDKVAKNPELSFTWCKKGAKAGNADAKWILSQYYKYGYGTPINFVKARKWLDRAAEAGHPSAKAAKQQGQECTIF